MDRNYGLTPRGETVIVALRKESVDRNPSEVSTSITIAVALRKESVDRNAKLGLNYTVQGESLSARRAWIEIIQDAYNGFAKQSLSARRAWIEICDRFNPCARLDSRSPQGERG